MNDIKDAEIAKEKVATEEYEDEEVLEQELEEEEDGVDEVSKKKKKKKVRSLWFDKALAVLQNDNNNHSLLTMEYYFLCRFMLEEEEEKGNNNGQSGQWKFGSYSRSFLRAEWYSVEKASWERLKPRFFYRFLYNSGTNRSSLYTGSEVVSVREVSHGGVSTVWEQPISHLRGGAEGQRKDAVGRVIVLFDARASCCGGPSAGT